MEEIDAIAERIHAAFQLELEPKRILMIKIAYMLWIGDLETECDGWTELYKKHCIKKDLINRDFHNPVYIKKKNCIFRRVFKKYDELQLSDDLRDFGKSLVVNVGNMIDNWIRFVIHELHLEIGDVKIMWTRYGMLDTVGMIRKWFQDNGDADILTKFRMACKLSLREEINELWQFCNYAIKKTICYRRDECLLLWCTYLDDQLENPDDVRSMFLNSLRVGNLSAAIFFWYEMDEIDRMHWLMQKLDHTVIAQMLCQQSYLHDCTACLFFKEFLIDNEMMALIDYGTFDTFLFGHLVHWPWHQANVMHFLRESGKTVARGQLWLFEQRIEEKMALEANIEKSIQSHRLELDMSRSHMATLFRIIHNQSMKDFSSKPEHYVPTLLLMVQLRDLELTKVMLTYIDKCTYDIKRKKLSEAFDEVEKMEDDKCVLLFFEAALEEGIDLDCGFALTECAGLVLRYTKLIVEGGRFQEADRISEKCRLAKALLDSIKKDARARPEAACKLLAKIWARPHLTIETIRAESVKALKWICGSSKGAKSYRKKALKPICKDMAKALFDDDESTKRDLFVSWCLS